MEEERAFGSRAGCKRQKATLTREKSGQEESKTNMTQEESGRNRGILTQKESVRRKKAF
jgi:hypothetical protein